MDPRQKKVLELNEVLKEKSANQIIAYILENYKEKATFATSLGAEDQVITEMIANIWPEANIFTLDTGRLFPETYDIIDITEKRYNVKIDIYFPDAEQIRIMVREKGINLFYESVENRKLCCNIRKLVPLRKALNEAHIWFSGLRREQSITRNETKLVEWDENNRMIKVNPLIDWKEEDVWDYIKSKNIPYNKLHDKGFPSIGCQPCTRAIAAGEDIRSGRWWWEEASYKECGLHKQ